MPFCTSTPGGQRLVNARSCATKQSPLSEQMEQNYFGSADNNNKLIQEQTQQLAETNAALSKLQKQFDNYQQQMISTNK